MISKLLIPIIMTTALISLSACSQKLDSLFYESSKMKIVTNIESDVFEIVNMGSGEKIKNLKFVKQIARTFQILDKDNNIYYINDDFEKMDSVNDFYGLCGTVPHYSMTIEEVDNKYVVMSDETFYDMGNEIPAEAQLSIEKSKAEKVVFINGENEFMYTSNFGIGVCSTDPNWLFLVKNEQFTSHHNPSLVYDFIDFNNYYHTLVTKKDGLYGVFGIVEPKYAEIQTFDYFLAKAILPNGREVVIDLEAREY